MSSTAENYLFIQGMPIMSFNYVYIFIMNLLQVGFALQKSKLKYK